VRHRPDPYADAAPIANRKGGGMAVQERQEQAGFEVKPRKPEPDKGKRAQLMWINHFELLPGDDSVKTSFNAVNSGIGGGLTGLVISSTTTGEIANGGGNKVVQMALEVPPGFIVNAVRVGYELTSSASFISQIRLAQVQDPPKTAIVLLDDGTDLTDVGPKDVDSASTAIDAAAGPLLLSLRVNFGSTSDRIVVRSLGLHLTEK
jgi:hypothetical protein